MTNSPFNTEFEISLRILLLLSLENGISANRISAIDFISTYGKDFNVSKSDLNGTSFYRAAKYANRKKLVNSAIKRLVLKNMIHPQKSESGFVYFISNRGNVVAARFQSDYSVDYINSCKRTKTLLSDNKTDLDQSIEKNVRTLERYKSLESQYKADLKRLDFILEGEHIEGEFPQNTRCPFCDNELNNEEEIEYKEAIKAERSSIEELLIDLNSTINSLNEEIAFQTKNGDDIRREFNHNRELIDSSFIPKMRDIKGLIAQMKRKLELESKLIAIQQIADTLGSDLESTNNEENQDEEFKPRDYFEDDFFNKMNLLMKPILESSYPRYLTSYFDKEKFDIVINSKPKKNEGKANIKKLLK